MCAGILIGEVGALVSVDGVCNRGAAMREVKLGNMLSPSPHRLLSQTQPQHAS